MSEFRLTMSGIRKSFGSTQALRGVELQVARGEVHALIGENGAGKSTLMKVLSGAVQPDGGSIDLDGKLYSPAGPKQACALGVAMIYQELTLAPDLTVEANVLLGLESSAFGFLQTSENRRRVARPFQRWSIRKLNSTRPCRRWAPAAAN